MIRLLSQLLDDPFTFSALGSLTFLQPSFHFAPFLTIEFWSMNYPQVIFSYNVALANCMIGDFCVIHCGVCIGQDGKAESYVKFSF